LIETQIIKPPEQNEFQQEPKKSKNINIIYPEQGIVSLMRSSSND